MRSTAQLLSISEEVLSLIISEIPQPPQKPPTNTIKPTIVKQPKKKPTKIPKNNKSPPTEIEDQIPSEESKQICEEFKSRIARLYQGNVKVKIIMALYDMRNGCFIHSFGNWERSPMRQRLYELRERITLLRSEGKTDEEIGKIMYIRNNKLKEIMGDLQRPKLIYAKEDIIEALCLYKTLRNKKKAAKELGISVSTLEEWIDKNRKGELRTIYDNDEGIHPMTILNALETYYLTRNLERASEISGLSVLKVSNFVEKCRLRSLEFKDRNKNVQENNNEQ